MISTTSYLTDIVANKQTLTVRIAQVYVCQAAAACIGSFGAGGLVRAVNLSYVVTIAMAMLFLGFFYTLIRLRQIPPIIMRYLRKINEVYFLFIEKYSKNRSREMVLLKDEGADREKLRALYDKHKKDEKSEEQEDRQAGCLMEFRKLLASVKQLYKAVGYTYVKPRPGRRRLYLWLSSILFFLYLMAELGLLHGPILGE